MTQSKFAFLFSILLLAACSEGGKNTQSSNPVVASYSIGGTVSGLKGTLQLKLNNLESLNVSANSNFVFDTNLEEGDSYAVKITQSPSNQACALTNQNGKVSNKNISSIKVVCADHIKTWTQPNSITDNISPDGQDASFSSVAVDNAGNTIIVWVQFDGLNNQVFKSEYRNGTWSNPSSINDNISPDGQDAIAPQVAMDNNGNAVIAWMQFNGFNFQVYKAEYRNGTWSYPVDLDDNISPDGQDVSAPQIAMNDNNEIVIAWSQNDGLNSQVFKAEYRAGIWTTPSSLDDNISPSSEYADDPKIALNDNGNAIITWVGLDGSNFQIFKSEYNAGVWSNPSSLSDHISLGGQDCDPPAIAMDAQGNAIIVWSQSDSANTQVFKAEYRSGAWTTPSTLSDNISPDGQSTSSAQVAISNDHAVIVWVQSDGVAAQIFKSEYDNGVWINPTNLNDNISPNDQDARYPFITTDFKNNFLITWNQADDTSFNQVFRATNQNGVWTIPSSLADNITPDGQNVDHVTSAMGDQGSIIVWEQPDGANYQIFKAEYR